jgi:DHA3 family macrolide efflux protein-like MFS transporter
MEGNLNWRKSFFTIYIGQAFSLLSSSAVQFSIIWWITMETGSAMALTIASVIGLLPQAIIGLFAGVWIDRFNRKKIMIIADSAVALQACY